MARERDLLASRIIFRAVLPVVKVMLEDDAKMRQMFDGVTGTIQFAAKDESGPVGGYLHFNNGEYRVVPEIAEKADITFSFSSVAKMNAMFAGKPVLPRIRGWSNFKLLVKTFKLLLALKILMPNVLPKTPEGKALKVKMTLHMVAVALSQMNKAGDPDMVKWTTKQPERIYQWSCEPEGIACYLRVKAGKTKAGRGYYTRRKPFVHMKFNGADAALKVLSNSVDTVQAIAQGYVVNDGSPEYGGQIGDFMQRVAALVS
ncbi:MAG TPA: hypothetical protein P5318_18385 [Candidatus Hydrogenedentes bacterium]|nr:hypothetical protein [Candidatus Hydrogenedentota bacterium]HRT22083.1 hypothetical protein [Candidatus Hydrogenedentota bacterium]HRT66841.1 hypothetical protein [Candidatus Hydrogenedentota bacterium]